MGLLTEACNPCLAEELEQEIGTRVAFFTVYGYGYFGKLERIVDSRVAILVQMPESEVITRFPNGSTGLNDFVYVDICTVIAKVTGLTESPFFSD